MKYRTIVTMAVYWVEIQNNQLIEKFRQNK